MIKVPRFMLLSLLIFQISGTKSELKRTEKLILKPDNEIFDLWASFPLDAPIDFYLFNWTNPKDFYNSSVKPKFEEVGPYRFLEKHKKSDIVWNDNSTVSYQQSIYWYFSDEEVKSDLEDTITTVNPIAVSLGHAGRSPNTHKPSISSLIASSGASIFMKKNVRELIFEGYSDQLLDSIRSTKPQISKKFGFLYKNNASIDFNSPFNIGTGENDDFAKLYFWNYKNATTSHFECDQNREFVKDFFQPPLPKTNISFYYFGMCRVIHLDYAGEETVHGLEGYKYTIGDYTFDNGTQYPENQCSCENECLPSGVFDMSSCAQGSPFFISLPHFNKADAFYTSGIEGLSSDHSNHSFSMTIEPNTGIPLRTEASYQLNMLLQPIEDIQLFDDIPQRYVLPMMWYEYRPTITPRMASIIKSYINNNK